MPLTGDYEPSTAGYARKQADRYEASGGAEANDLRGRPIIVLTSVGARTGKLRKTALMRVEHDGDYAVVASQGGAPEASRLVSQPQGEPARRAPGRPDQERLRRARGDRRREGDLVGPAVETWPDYAKYQTKTSRQIPVFVLEAARPIGSPNEPTVISDGRWRRSPQDGS